MADLYWHCAHCGSHERAEPTYVDGERKPCIDCGQINEVMTIQRAAALEQGLALGRPPHAGEVTP